jgi:TrwC relaxase
MLSIGSIKSASGAAGYYAKDNYYIEGEAKDASEWFGKAAAALGLEGPVDPKVFEAVLLGQLPNGKQIQAGSKGHRAGFDLTFSAPKSLSLMALVGGDTFTLKAIEGEGDTARLRLEDKAGRAHLLERGDPMRQPLGAAGALNMHRVQGQTTPRAITVLSEGDRMLNSQSLAYVLTSRARDGFTLFVDDRERVIQKIERNDGKAPHATEIVGDAVQTIKTQALKPELPPLGIDDALREKLAALSKEADRTNTLPVPQKQLGLELCGVSF